MIWHDFMFADGQYPCYPEFEESVRTEVTQQVKRLRNYCSLVIWAGNNEDYQVAAQFDLTYDPNDHSGDWRNTDFRERALGHVGSAHGRRADTNTHTFFQRLELCTRRSFPPSSSNTRRCPTIRAARGEERVTTMLPLETSSALRWTSPLKLIRSLTDLIALICSSCELRSVWSVWHGDQLPYQTGYAESGEP